jgi:rhomboid protease GluP
LANLPDGPVTQALIGVLILVFVATVLLGGGLMLGEPRVLLVLGSNFGPLTLRGEWWRLFASMFLHSGVIHLAFNAMALWQLGPLAERLYGRWHYLLLYLTAGVGGGFASLLWHPDANTVGASGAIFGLIGGLLAFVSRKDLGVPLQAIHYLRRSLLSYGGVSLAMGFAIPMVNNAAHVGGLITGYVAGLALARPIDAAARQGRGRLRLLIVVAAVITGFAALGLWLQA